MNKVEEVARAIFDALDPTRGDAIGVTLHHSEFVEAETVDEQIEQVMSICRSAARAAIAAMEKPTEEMIEALHDAAAQIVYLHEKFGETGTGNATLARIHRALSKAGND